MVHVAKRSAKIILWTFLLLAGRQVPGQAYVLSSSSSMVHASDYANKPLEEDPLRQPGRPLHILQQFMEDNSREIAQKARRSTQGVYDSYRKFKPNRYPENSPEWNVAMIQYLLDMKKNGHKIKEIETSKSLPELHKVLTDGGQGLVYEDPGTGIESTLKIIGQETEEGVQTDDGSKIDPIICKMEPFNVCYRVNSKGMMHPLGDRRPVRLLRVYRK